MKLMTSAPHHDYWDSFYASRASGGVPEEPSAFGRWVLDELAPGQPVVEFGFGTARDALWFADRGHQVLGYDFAESAVHQAQGRADGRSLPAGFEVLDLYDGPRVDAVATELAGTVAAPALYGRFLIHSLEESGRRHLLDLAARVLNGGGQLYLEFRTGKDAGGTHLFGDDHFRVYLDPDLVVGEVEARGGRVSVLQEGHGFAVYKSEDPHVARLVATF
jgi:hypothetical protein